MGMELGGRELNRGDGGEKHLGEGRVPRLFCIYELAPRSLSLIEPFIDSSFYCHLRVPQTFLFHNGKQSNRGL